MDIIVKTMWFRATALVFLGLAGLPSFAQYQTFTNTAAGSASGQGGEHNSNFGYYTGDQIYSGKYNTNIGSQAGQVLTAGSYNSNLGYQAGNRLTSGHRNTNVGVQAGYALTTGAYNSNFGIGAGYSLTTGYENTNIGDFAGEKITTGYFNTTLGNSSGRSLTTGIQNVLLGTDAGLNGIKTTRGNTAIGPYAFRDLPGETNYNVAIGYSAGRGYAIPGSKSVFVLNNQAQTSNPLLFGNFADNSNHDLSTSAVAAGSKAQLAVNTSYLEEGMTLTVNGPTYIGNFEANGINTGFVRDTLLQDFYLWVEKGIVSEDFVLAKVTSWGDYVFAPGYRLKPLSEVEAYIRAHAHLPGVPSEAELTKNGYNLHQMNKNLMVKVEELTLYAIGQEKEMKKLREKLDQYEGLAQEIEKLRQAVQENRK